MPPISSFTLSKRDYYADFFTVPVATSIAVVWLYSLHVVPARDFALAIFAGLFGWSFIEYGIHRWVLHGIYRRAHAAHHIRPKVFFGVSSVTTAVIGAIAFWALTCAFGPVIGVGLLVGLVLGYFAYIYVHDRVHHGTFAADSILAKLAAMHEYHHHRHYHKNFGVTSPLWDIVFGTYKAAR